MKWSVEGQSPDYLAVTRMATLSPRVVSTILDCIHLEPGMRVLDVGCGSGEYVFRLGHQVRGVDFVGLEYDGDFVDLANKRAAGEDDPLYEPVDPNNTYTFLQGDGLHLPFLDGAFDAVISHTYLTAISDYQGALAEMIRVCKPGGQVSSVTNLNSNFGGTGGFKLFPPVVDSSMSALVTKIDALKRSMSYIDMGSGVPTHKVQRLFAHLCLDEVAAMPLGQYFCLSDAATTPEDYKRYVELLYRIECNDVARMRKTPACCEQTTEEEWETYLAFAEMRRDYLLSIQGANQEWTWFGGAALLVWGTVPQEGLTHLCATIAAEREEADKCRQEALAQGLIVNERLVQAGPGRVCRVQLEIEGAVSDDAAASDDANDDAAAKTKNPKSHKFKKGKRRAKKERKKNHVRKKTASTETSAGQDADQGAGQVAGQTAGKDAGQVAGQGVGQDAENGSKAVDYAAFLKGARLVGAAQDASTTDPKTPRIVGATQNASTTDPKTPRIVNASGFNPSLAFEEAYEIALGKNSEKRAHCEAAEKTVWDALKAGKLLSSPLAYGETYDIDLMWDTLAETMELGWGVYFFDVTANVDLPAVFCEVHANGYRHQAVAAHPDRDVAIMRSLSRALAKTAPPFL